MTPNFLPNFGYIQDRLPRDLFKSIRKECLSIEKQKKTEMISDLSGEGVPKHYWLEDTKSDFTRYLSELILEYNSYFNAFNHIKLFDRDVPLKINTPWVNVQKKHEFIPNHTHGGLLSYALWVKIPYNLDDELKTGKYASTFEFNYNTIMGTNLDYRIELDKSYEGELILFPANLQHCVYPFYTSDDTRISVSGNVFYDI